MNCRHCGALLELLLLDLGGAPISNAYVTGNRLQTPETWYPLRVLVCEHCWLVQTQDFTRARELFDADYSYFSSYSDTWLAHAETFVKDMVARFALDETCHVVEVGANDGYLLQYVQRRGIPCTGIEPTASTASAARDRGIRIVEEFFGSNLAAALADQDGQADLMIANNVLAHVPDINDFVSAFSLLLKPAGVASFEFPHLMRLLDQNQFDTVYHEHFSYLSLNTVERIFEANGLSVFDVEELPTHGGSLRVFAQRSRSGGRMRSAEVERLMECERKFGLVTALGYAGFQGRVNEIKNAFLSLLLELKRSGKTVAAYGAAAKGNTLLNYAGVKSDLLPFVVDRNPWKQGKYLPGSHIEIRDEEYLKVIRPDYVVILPWNLKDEIVNQLRYVREWGGQFVTAIPRLEII